MTMAVDDLSGTDMSDTLRSMPARTTTKNRTGRRRDRQIRRRKGEPAGKEREAKTTKRQRARKKH